MGPDNNQKQDKSYKMSVVSVIIPVYNVERYLCKCIDSILAQKFEDFEVLLVNDGSSDSSGEICDTYARKDARIKSFHKVNEGPSAARNFGLNKAVGKWITFVDSDDFVGKDYLKLFVENAIAHEAQHVIFGVTTVGFQDNIINNSHISAKNIVSSCDNNEIIQLGLLNHWGVAGKLFSTRIIRDNNIRFNCKIRVGEDGVFWHKYLLNTDKIVTLPDKQYFYLKSMENQGISSVNPPIINNIELCAEYKTLSYSLIDKFGFRDSKYANDIVRLYLDRLRRLIIINKRDYDNNREAIDVLKFENLKYFDLKNYKDIPLVALKYISPLVVNRLVNICRK